MPRDVNGTYIPPLNSAYPAVVGTPIHPGHFNVLIADMARAISECAQRTGESGGLMPAPHDQPAHASPIAVADNQAVTAEILMQMANRLIALEHDVALLQRTLARVGEGAEIMMQKVTSKDAEPWPR